MALALNADRVDFGLGTFETGVSRSLLLRRGALSREFDSFQYLFHDLRVKDRATVEGNRHPQ